MRCNMIERSMNRVVGTDEKVGSCFGQLIGRGKHQVGDAVPIIAIDEVHVLGEAVTMHADFRMPVRSQQGRRFVADGAKTQRRTFSAAGDDTDVLGHAQLQFKPFG
jgi:hypothetical protein